MGEADPAYAFFLETAVRISKVVLRLHDSGKLGSLAVFVILQVHGACRAFPVKSVRKRP